MDTEPKKLYQVKNLSGKSILRDWCFNLFSEKMKKDWEAFKLTDDYKGRSDIEKDARKDMPEALKIKQWANQFGIGTKHYFTHSSNPGGETNYLFELYAGDNILDEDQLKEFAYLEKRTIEQFNHERKPTGQVSVEGFLEIIDVSDLIRNIKILDAEIRKNLPLYLAGQMDIAKEIKANITDEEEAKKIAEQYTGLIKEIKQVFQKPVETLRKYGHIPSMEQAQVENEYQKKMEALEAREKALKAKEEELDRKSGKVVKKNVK